jgi:hypothetical protein
MNMTTATTTDIRYEYAYKIGHNECLPSIFCKDIFIYHTFVITHISNIFCLGENIYMNRLYEVSAIQIRNEIVVVDEEADIAITFRKGSF